MTFFTSIDNSVTLNRFSQDMMLIEAVLPTMIYIVLQSKCLLLKVIIASLTASGAIACIIQLVLVAMGSKYMGATVIPLLLALYFIQNFYLRTSRQMRFLDLEAKSPLYRQFTETIEGIATIRASGSQEWFRREFLSLLDESQKPYYLLLCVQRWLGLVLNMLVGAAAVVLMALALTTESSSAGSLGVALTTILTANTQLQHLISSWTQAETSVGSVARTKNFATKTANENLPPAEHKEEPDSSWPKGAITVNGLAFKYQNGGDELVALDNVNFDVKIGQNLGIIGRTGRYVAKASPEIDSNFCLAERAH
jgi:ATP-binding cassette, subfamily C (CFTR/MRP), member 1